MRGAALLAAMLTVTLVATLAAAALWQQWRGVAIETAERSRIESAWILTGALDWSRLILREDGRSGGADHLAEPWATPLAEARLSSFLSSDQTVSDDGQEAFLSGRISDAQARLNVSNLVKTDQTIDPAALAAFAKLFELLGLPADQLATLAENLRLALDPGANPSTTAAALAPQRVEQLVWLGLPRATLEVLKPYITLLPAATPVNLNTASAEVIYACVPKLDLSDAKRLVQQRERAPFRDITEAGKAIGAAFVLVPAQQDVKTSYFEVRGRLRLDQSVLEELSLVRRTGSGAATEVKTLWRERRVSENSPTATP
jgi:general secretion pathway protein K